jgi:16S rRNA (cytidine1402-2'-O)-methyltransferase
VSDPGARLVSAAREAGIEVVPVPGASAVLAALVASGLPTRRFTFLGFAPRKGAARRAWFEDAARAPGTLVLFEAANRVADTLEALYLRLGPRRAAIARELTKRYEQVVHGRLGELRLVKERGEVTIVVEGGEAEDGPNDADVDRLIGSLLERGGSARDVASEVAERTGRRRSEVYARVLALKNA